MNPDHDKFLQTTGLCVALHCQLSLEACANIRRRESPPPQCNGCPGPDFGPDYRPKPVPAKEVVVDPEPARKTVTMQQLAKLAGANYSSIFSIVRAFQSGGSKSGPTAAKLIKALEDNGLTWNDVVRQPKKGRPKMVKAPSAVPAKPATEAPAPAPTQVTKTAADYGFTSLPGDPAWPLPTVAVEPPSPGPVPKITEVCTLARPFNEFQTAPLERLLAAALDRLPEGSSVAVTIHKLPEGS